MSDPGHAGMIRVRGARTHNLHNVSLDVPRGRLVVFTGVSGSGKSSLVFDTIFAEGQRRFLTTLPNLPDHLTPRRPPVDAIEGLPPVLSVSQSSGAPRPRSTLATLTEIHDHLRLLWARRGTPYCPDCQIPIHQQTLAEIGRAVMAMAAGTKIFLLAPLVHETPGRHVDVFQKIRQEGFLRARIDGVLYEIRDTPSIDAKKPHTIDLVIDRLVVREGMADRLMESLASCARQGDGRVIISDVEETGDWNDITFSTKLACPRCRRVSPDLEPRRFHFNTPHGACPRCMGMGVIDGPATEDEDPPTIICPECAGTRLNREARAVRYEGVRLDRGDLVATPSQGLSLTDVTARTVADALVVFRKAHIDLDHPLAKVETILVNEIVTRLHFLAEVGLGYLALDRPSATLSGGELQRARLATRLGGGLRGVCFILDEPTLGLHPRDTLRLLAALRALQEKGNSLLVVEHDETVMRHADYLVDLGPGAGPLGGHILAAGTVDEVLHDPQSVTAAFLRGDIAPPQTRIAAPLDPAKALIVRAARHHNLKNIDVVIPLGRLVAVTGVSGSGKSSLVHDILARAVRRHLGLQTEPPGVHDALEGLDLIDTLIEADQRPLGRSARSSAATYTGLFEEIRKLFTLTRTAKLRGYKANRFSFNSRGGRCEECQGRGELVPAGPFLFDLMIPCPACHGQRFNPGTLEVLFKGQSIADVLAMPVAPAREYFKAVPKIVRVLAALDDVGLGYLPIGQPATRLSGGEAQRVKLATELARTATGRTLLILDEPTSGLHRLDIARLLSVLRRLVDAGNTVVVIEHHLDIIAAADWIIDLGPDAGQAGGHLVAAGPPATIEACEASLTGRFLRSWRGEV
ncbi:MAG: ABC-ATPase UvrA [Planctomycetota bacterium]